MTWRPTLHQPLLRFESCEWDGNLRYVFWNVWAILRHRDPRFFSATTWWFTESNNGKPLTGNISSNLLCCQGVVLLYKLLQITCKCTYQQTNRCIICILILDSMYMVWWGYITSLYLLKSHEMWLLRLLHCFFNTHTSWCLFLLSALVYVLYHVIIT